MMQLEEMIKEKISHYSQAIGAGSAKKDEHALAEIEFFLALRRILSKKATPADLGLFDAINDTLQARELIESHQTFYK